MRRTIRIFSVSLAAVAVATAILAGACADDSNDDLTDRSHEPAATAPAGQPSATPVLTPALPPTQAPTNETTGIAAVDATMKLVRERDLGAIAGVVHLSEFACITSSQGAGGPPRCEAGETPGQKVKALPWSGCEFQYARESSVRSRLKAMVVDNQMAPVALVRLPAGSKLGFFEGERYGLIYEVAGGTGLMIGLTEGGHIIRLSQGCQAPASELVSRADPGAILKQFK